MNYAYGNNNQNSALTFLNRKNYDENVMPIFFEEPTKNTLDTYIDIFVNKPFYGRIDENSNSVLTGLPLKRTPTIENYFDPVDEYRFLKKIPNTSLYAMNFVVDAFQDMATYFNRSCQTVNDLQKIGPFSSIEAKRAWVPVFSRYFTYLREIFFIYKNKVTSDFPEELDKIKNFDDFIKYFSSFLMRNTDTFSILFSSFMISKNIFPGCSGLIIETAIDDYSDDFIKSSIYLNDRNYLFFKNTAVKYGFYLDRNVPWRLIANISSDAMLPYMKKYQLESVNDVFSRQYVKSYLYDILLLKNAFLYCYGILIETSPRYKTTSENICDDSKRKVPRDLIDPQQLNKKYRDENWIKLYLNLRLKSVRYDPRSNSAKYLIKDVDAMLKSKGLEKTLEFINNKLSDYKNVLLDKEYLTTKFQDDIKDTEDMG